MDSFELVFGARVASRCRFVVGHGTIGRVPELVASGGGRRVVVVSDANVARLHGRALVDALTAVHLDAHLVTFPAGETSKTRETKARIEDELAVRRAGRDVTIVALGGGVTGDLAGFVAATWCRGVRFIQAPTTVLAMVDAAIGGKTAVDVPGGKNLVGAFHQPEAVIADLELLDTLPAGEFRSGLSEVVKTAAVADIGLFRFLEREAERLLERDPAVLEHVVVGCARRKARIVSRDERDRGRRAVLNFGHTVGHAIEAESGWSRAHGDAVAIGMVVEGNVAVARSGFPPAHQRRLVDLLERLGLPVRAPASSSARAMSEIAALDKKTLGGTIRCALPVRLGKMPVDRDGGVLTDVEPELLRLAWSQCVAD